MKVEVAAFKLSDLWFMETSKKNKKNSTTYFRTKKKKKQKIFILLFHHSLYKVNYWIYLCVSFTFENLLKNQCILIFQKKK